MPRTNISGAKRIPRETLRSNVREVKVDKFGNGGKDWITFDEVNELYPSLMPLMRKTPEEDRRLFTRVRIVIDDPDRTPSNKYEGPVGAEIHVFGNHDKRITRMTYDDNGMKVPLLDANKKPVEFSVFDPEGDVYSKIISLEKKVIKARLDSNTIPIEITAYKNSDFDKTFPVYKASAGDILNMKINDAVPRKNYPLRPDWIKANPDDAKKLIENHPELAPKGHGGFPPKEDLKGARP